MRISLQTAGEGEAGVLPAYETDSFLHISIAANAVLIKQTVFEKIGMTIAAMYPLYAVVEQLKSHEALGRERWS